MKNLKQNFTREEVYQLLKQFGSQLVYDWNDHGFDQPTSEDEAEKDLVKFFPLKEEDETYCGYTLEQLQHLITEAQEIYNADVNLSRTKNQRTYIPSPNPSQDILIKIGVWDEEGCFKSNRYGVEILEKLSTWYDHEYC
jgi:hypothetical protein